MDKEQAEVIKSRVEAALVGMNDDTLKVTVTHGHFGTTAVKLNVEVSEKAADNNAKTIEAEAFVENAEKHGYKAGWLFSTFSNDRWAQDDLAFKIVGFNPRSPKMPVLLEGAMTKRRYKISIQQLKEVMR